MTDRVVPRCDRLLNVAGCHDLCDWRGARAVPLEGHNRGGWSHVDVPCTEAALWMVTRYVWPGFGRTYAKFCTHHAREHVFLLVRDGVAP